MSDIHSQPVVPEYFNISGGLNGLGKDMHMEIIGHLDSFNAVPSYLLSSKRTSSLIRSNGIKKFIGYPSAIVIYSKLLLPTTPVSESSLESIERLLGLQNEPLFLVLSTRHSDHLEFPPPQYIEILIRNGILPAVLSALNQEQNDEMQAFFKGILRMLAHHTGAKLWQCKKTNKEMAELFYSASVAVLEGSSEIVQDYLFVVLRRWVSVDRAHREALSSKEIEISSSSLSILDEPFSDDDEEAVQLSERQREVIFFIASLMNAGYSVKEADRERLKKRLPVLKNETEDRADRLEQEAELFIRRYWLMTDTEFACGNLLQMLSEEEKNEGEEITALEKEDEVREIRATNKLPSLPIHFANPTKMKIQGTSIIYLRSKMLSTCLIGDEMKHGIYRLTFKIVRLPEPFFTCGVIDSSLGCPEVRDTLTRSHKGVEWNSCGTALLNQQCHRVQDIPSDPTEGSIITMEVDLRSDEPAKRTLHWYHKGKDIGGFFFNLPPSIRFGLVLYEMGDSVEFISLEECSSLLNGGAVEGKGWRFEGGDEPVRV